jgi:hypothetical protein
MKKKNIGSSVDIRLRDGVQQPEKPLDVLYDQRPTIAMIGHSGQDFHGKARCNVSKRERGVDVPSTGTSLYGLTTRNRRNPPPATPWAVADPPVVLKWPDSIERVDDYSILAANKYLTCLA